MKISKRQLRRIIKEEKAKLINEAYGESQYPAPEQFTSMCMESVDILIGEGNAQGMMFVDIIGEIQRCLDKLAEEGW